MPSLGSRRGGTQADREIVFLGTSACLLIPSFHCDCETCERARRNPTLRRTRASLALLGRENTIIDPDPDLDHQLERESIRQVHRIFITHWHNDHIAGLGNLAEPSWLNDWPLIDLYAPAEVMWQFEQSWEFVAHRLRLHPVKPGDVIETPDAEWEVVKTTHTTNSVGYVAEAGKRFAYLVDSIEPPQATVERLTGIDLLILESAVDEFRPEPDETRWSNFAVPEAVAFWQNTGIPECIITHWSGHTWKQRRMVAGWSEEERDRFVARHPGLRFATDGLRIRV